MNRGRFAAILLVLLMLLGPAWPRDDGAPLANPAREYFTDTQLLDQDGRSHRFYSDLIMGRIVIINVIFISCRSSCPVVMARLAELQELLDPRIGEVAFLSISVDPVMDTPQALRAYADELHARPGWYFLTGSQAQPVVPLPPFSYPEKFEGADPLDPYTPLMRAYPGETVEIRTLVGAHGAAFIQHARS
jgi:cytochrome oxidase Cu insertion factor (SCO1/SenC/PrrC family)